MKIVINDCFGGFGLSQIAQAKYLELLGGKAYFYKQTHHSFEHGYNKYERCSDNDECLFSITLTKDFGDSFEVSPKGYGFHVGDIERDDKNLIKVVELLGVRASGRFAELKIVEIPDDIEYTIEEYDGSEHIAEKHRTWN